METRSFLDRVLPKSGGDFFGASVSPQDKFSQSKLNNLDALDSYIASRKKQRHNVYFATGVYDGTREADHVVFKKALYLDIDCGDGKPYPSKKAGGRALAGFCKETGLPAPTIIVDSGNGLHPYWTFNNEVSSESWQPVASALKLLCEAHGLHVDPGITADSARILRVPGTVNYKDPDNPTKVRVIYSAPYDYEFDTLREKLGTCTSRASGLGAIADDGDLDGGLNEQDDRPRYAGPILEGCPVLARTLETGGADQQEPLWAVTMNLLAYTIDGDQFIHALSEGHDKYDYNSTERKFQYAKRRKEQGRSGPTLCKTFAMWMPSKCKECRHNGHISTPLQLGIEQENELPYGFKQNDKGIFRARTRVEGGEESVEWQRIAPYQIRDFMVLLDNSADGDREYWIRFDRVLSDEVTHCTFPLSELADNRAFAKALSRGGIIIMDQFFTDFRCLMKAWTQKMQAARLIQQRVSQLGWTKRGEKVGFSLAENTHWSDGSDEVIVASDPRLVSQYIPEGERAPWLALSHTITNQGRPAINAAIASAFAAPLIKFTGVSGAMFTLVSRESGTGKTSALRLAQAVWGCPRRAIHALDDTPKSVAKKLGYLNNLPSYWDEIRMEDEVRGFVKLMFQLGQGKERSRLTSSTATQAMGTWTTLITAASNESIVDHLDVMVRSSNAGRMRIFEVEVPPLLETRPLTKELMALEDNYGTVGVEYAQWLVQHHAEVDKMVTTMQEKLRAKLSSTAEERFWLATVTCLYVGALLANRLGYTTIALRPLLRWLLDQFKTIRGESAEIHVPVNDKAVDLVLKYAASLRDHTVVVDHLTNRAVRDCGVVHIEPHRGEILAAIGRKDKMIRILVPHFTEWLYSIAKDSPSQIIKALIVQRIANHTRRSVTCGIANAVDTGQRTLDVRLDKQNFLTLDDPFE